MALTISYICGPVYVGNHELNKAWPVTASEQIKLMYFVNLCAG